ncbi:uncharacterized protein MONOS_17255 [Monocercomonoides exilis]|uniref:uncharacterized protein n=1 Tax=Monocercomonoides exilis TaxID=2049356 RepID=UPI00355A67FA|nr:hypothetical protein MONOS_17255 [Monocercomonoides exilis]
MEVEEEEEVVEMKGLSECEGRDGSDRGDWGEEMLEKRVGEEEEEMEGEEEGEGEEKEEDESENEKDEGEGERDGDGEGEGEEREEGEKRKDWMREMKEEKEKWEMEKEQGLWSGHVGGDCLGWRRGGRRGRRKKKIKFVSFHASFRTLLQLFVY